MSFDPTKPVQTRDGRKARIICTDKVGPFPLCVLVEKDKDEHFISYLADGTYQRGTTDPLDLINIPVEHERTYWLVHTAGGTYSTLSVPRGMLGVIAITGPHQVTFKEGEGLEVS